MYARNGMHHTHTCLVLTVRPFAFCACGRRNVTGYATHRQKTLILGYHITECAHRHKKTVGYLRLRGHGAVEGGVKAGRATEGKRMQAVAVRGRRGGGRLLQQLGCAQKGVLAAQAGLLQLVQRQRVLPLKRLQPLIVPLLHTKQRKSGHALP